MSENGHLKFEQRAWGPLIVALVILSACGVPTDRAATPIPDDSVPYSLLASTTTTISGAAQQGQETHVCLVLNSSILFVGRSRSGPERLETLKDAALARPTDKEASKLGVRSAITSREMVKTVTLDGTTATVDLGSEFVDLPSREQLLAVAQLTCTMTGQPGVAKVEFYLDGKAIEVPLADGSAVTRPVTRADYDDLIVD